MSRFYELIWEAINEKKQVIATYRGFRREMCPHVLGSKGGRPQALFYQFGGESSSGLSSDPTQNWRCMYIDELAKVEVVSGEFHTAPNHTRPQTCVDSIDIEVSY